MSETGEMKAARKEIRELKGALAAHTDWCLESAFLDIACKRPWTTAAELKKHAVTLADVRRTRGKDEPEIESERDVRAAWYDPCQFCNAHRVGRSGKRTMRGRFSPGSGAQAALHMGRETRGERHQTLP